MRTILLISIIFLAAGCTKDQACQSWQYYDECQPKNSSTFCTGPNGDYRTGQFCGDDLDGVSAGASKTIHESADARIIRHFIKRM